MLLQVLAILVTRLNSVAIKLRNRTLKLKNVIEIESKFDFESMVL